MNQNTDQQRKHPLRMMPADHDDPRHTQGGQGSRIEARPHMFSRKGSGKGRKGSHNHTGNSASIKDFILPEMLQDPWVANYHTLSADIRIKETSHLSVSELDRVDSNVQFTPEAKRYNLV